MKVTIIEGTPEEILKTIPSLNPAISTTVVSGDVEVVHAEPSDDSDEEVTYVSTAVARLVLNRRPLSKEQRIVLKTVYDAHPKMVFASDLQKKTSYRRPQFTGLMGAFGRRLTHTKGYVSDTWFFKQEWDVDAKCYRYGLPDTVREAIRLENLF